MISRYKAITAALIISLFLSMLESARAWWWKEVHIVYLLHEGQCTSLPPFITTLGNVVLRYDRFEENSYLSIHLDLNSTFEKQENVKIRNVIIDDRDFFEIYSLVSDGWSVAEILEQERFIKEFAEGKSLLFFINDGKSAKIDLLNIEKGPKHFIEMLKLCNEDQRTGHSHRSRYE